MTDDFTGKSYAIPTHVIEKLEKHFLLEYHKADLIKMVRGIWSFLERDEFLPFHNNQHYQYLKSEMERHNRDYERSPHNFPAELPGMVYGMYFNAWNKLKADLINGKTEQG